MDSRLEDSVCGHHVSAEGLPLQDTENVLQRLVHALQELMDVSSRVTGHVTADPVIMDAVANAKAVRYHGGKAPQVDRRTAERAGGQDVVVDGGVGWVSVELVQSLTLCLGQVPESKEVSVKSLT